MTDLILEAKKREKDIKPRAVRDGGDIPAVLYGHNTENILLSLPYSPFMKVFGEAGTNILIDLKVGSENPKKVLIHDIDHDVVSNAVRHVDLYQVRMDEKIHTDIPVHFIGEAPAVKGLGGTLVTQIEAIPVKCFPKDLIKFVEVDLSPLVNFDTAIRISDVSLGSALEVLRDSNDVIASVAPPRVEKEEDTASTEDDAGAAEGEEEKKTKEDEAGEKTGDQEDSRKQTE